MQKWTNGDEYRESIKKKEDMDRAHTVKIMGVYVGNWLNIIRWIWFIFLFMKYEGYWKL